MIPALTLALAETLHPSTPRRPLCYAARRHAEALAAFLDTTAAIVAHAPASELVGLEAHAEALLVSAWSAMPPAQRAARQAGSS